MATLDSTNGLCPAGRATLAAHADRLQRQEICINALDAKVDKATYLLIATLVTGLINLATMWFGK